MENKNGNGIFLGIVSVATLIVAILGATFAYFSATTESDPNAVGVGAYEFNLDLDITRVYPAEGNSPALIPLDPGGTVSGVTTTNTSNLLYAINEVEDRCIDDHGLAVCVLYQVTIKNYGANQVTLTGKLEATTNNSNGKTGFTPFKNLMYQAVSGSHEPDDETGLSSLTLGVAEAEGLEGIDLDAFAQPVNISGTIPEGTNPDDEAQYKVFDIAPIVVPGGTPNSEGEITEENAGVGTSYVLIYLQENGNQSSEMGATYTGKLTYSSGDDEDTGLTGAFTVKGPTQDPVGP